MAPRVVQRRRSHPSTSSTIRPRPAASGKLAGMRGVACTWLLAGGLLGRDGVAQGLPAGFTDLTFTNTSGSGTPAMPATVWYPATSAGHGTPLRPQPGGYPVVV